MMAVYIGDIRGTWAYTPEKGPEHGKIGEPLPGQPSHLERRELEGALKARQSRLLSVQEAPGPGSASQSRRPQALAAEQQS